MKNQAGSTRMDTVLKMMLIAFISLLAFSSGVYFGKQLSDSDYQLKALEGDFGKGTKNAKAETGHKEDSGANPEDAINEEEVAAMSEKFVNGEKEGEKESRGIASAETAHEGHAPATHETEAAAETHGATHEAAHEAAATHGAAHEGHAAAAHEAGHAAAHEAAHEATKSEGAREAKAETAHGNTKPDLSAVHKAAARVAMNAAPAEAAKTEAKEGRAPTSLPRTVGASADVEFTVQVASYPTMEAAKLKADDLKQKGFVAFPVEAVIEGKTWYRVSVGTFKTYKEATAYRGQFLKATNLKTALVQKIQR